MTTLELPIGTTAGIWRTALSGLRTFSGLAVVLGVILFVIFSDGGAGGASTNQGGRTFTFPGCGHRQQGRGDNASDVLSR